QYRTGDRNRHPHHDHDANRHGCADRDRDSNPHDAARHAGYAWANAAADAWHAHKHAIARYTVTHRAAHIHSHANAHRGASADPARDSTPHGAARHAGYAGANAAADACHAHKPAIARYTVTHRAARLHSHASAHRGALADPYALA